MRQQSCLGTIISENNAVVGKRVFLSCGLKCVNARGNRLFLMCPMASRMGLVLLRSSRQVPLHLLCSLDLFLKHGELGGVGLGPLDEPTQRWKQRLSKRRER